MIALKTLTLNRVWSVGSADRRPLRICCRLPRGDRSRGCTLARWCHRRDGLCAIDAKADTADRRCSRTNESAWASIVQRRLGWHRRQRGSASAGTRQRRATRTVVGGYCAASYSWTSASAIVFALQSFRPASTASSRRACPSAPHRIFSCSARRRIERCIVSCA